MEAVYHEFTPGYLAQSEAIFDPIQLAAYRVDRPFLKKGKRPAKKEDK